MAEILYGVSPIGLGHASRAAAVGLKLREIGIRPVFATGGNASPFLRSYGFDVRDVVTEPTPSERDGKMMYPGLWYVRYWRGYRATKSRMTSLVDELRPKTIVGDEEFSCVSLAIERGITHALISDELQLGFARSALSRYIERRVSAWYTDLQHRTSSILVPDFGVDHGNVRFVSPIVRSVTRTRDQIASSLGIGPGNKIVLLSASGSGIGGFLVDRVAQVLRKLRLADVVLVVTGLPGGPGGSEARYVGVERDNQDFVAAADLVISTAGKSTIDEAKSFGSPIIAIPIKNHSEQEGNAASVGFKPEDIDRLDVLIPKYLGRRTEPQSFRGAETVAGLVRGMM